MRTLSVGCCCVLKILNLHFATEFVLLGVLYFVDVTTGSESKSGTPSRVFFKLIGENGAHGEVELGKDFSRGRFVLQSLKLLNNLST